MTAVDEKQDKINQKKKVFASRMHTVIAGKLQRGLTLNCF